MNIRAKIFGGSDEAVEQPFVMPAKRPKGAKADVLHSIPVPREEHRRCNTRDGDRHRLSVDQVRVAHAGRLHDVELINLSGGGAMITGNFEPMLWDRVDLHLAGDGVIECAVRWLKGDRIGLEFAHETQLDCSPDEQTKLLRTVLHQNFKDGEFEAPARDSEPQPDDDDQRVATRHPLIWSGMLHYDFQSAPVRLRTSRAPVH